MYRFVATLLLIYAIYAVVLGFTYRSSSFGVTGFAVAAAAVSILTLRGQHHWLGTGLLILAAASSLAGFMQSDLGTISLAHMLEWSFWSAWGLVLSRFANPALAGSGQSAD